MILLLAVSLIALLAASQLLLPRLAERRLAGALESSGDVERVSVQAFPALKLLRDRADRVEVRLGETRSGPGQLGDLLARTRDAEEVDARAAALRLGPLKLSDLRMGKRGPELAGQAVVTRAALAAALPPTIGFRPLATRDGELVLEASAGVLGLRARVRARLSARDGALVIAPDVPLGGLAALTVFRDPRVEVTGVGARETADGYALTATARLREE